MSYDLDDGYDAIGSKWCVGYNEARDPSYGPLKAVGCSNVQVEAITKMYLDL